MAIYSSVAPPDQQVQVQAFATQAQSTAELSIRGTNGVTLSIPLDDTAEISKESRLRPRKEPLRRDSLKRREALLRGKEGSRRRQRWENDRLLHVPNAQPPLPSDWEVHPTYPVQRVPYYLAPLWDLRPELHNKSKSKGTAKNTTSEKGRVPQDLKAKMKKSKGAKTLLQELELEVRKFVREYEQSLANRNNTKSSDVESEIDSEDEEIVFVGRNGTMSDLEKRMEKVLILEKERKIWEGAVNDSGAGFGRWLVHSIAEYYGLASRSVTVGNPARRESYVAIKEVKMRTGKEMAGAEMGELPRPLYGLV